jgi:hypothetical protein
MHLEHLDDERIQRLLHDELDAAAQEDASRHLRGCAPCAGRLDEARREEEWIFEELSRTDDALPHVDAQSVARLARREASRWMSRAAGVLIAIAAGGAVYAIPGSPVRGWVDRALLFFAGEAGPPPRLEVATEGEEGAAARAPTSSGIAVAPGERFAIRFAASQSEGVVAVSLTEEDEVVARALGAKVTFTTDVSRLIIENFSSAASYEIELPKKAPWIEIEVGQRRLLLKDGPQIVGHGTQDALGRYVLSLAP